MGDIIYYHNGTVAYGPANGTLTVTNPTLSSPLSGANITLPNGSTLFIDRIGPLSSYTVGYGIDRGDVKIPLSLKETITPSSLSPGMRQQARLCVQAENVGTGNVTGFKYQKTLPPGLSTAWAAYDGGTLDANGTVTWALATLAPGETRSLAIAFNLTPSSNVYFPEAYISFDYGASLAGVDPGFSASTTTSFQAQKSPVSDGAWQVSAIVPDDSEFIIDLKTVSISRSNASDPFDMATIASYTPDTAMSPGCSWAASLIDNFGVAPAYFIKVSYDLPYTFDGRSYLSDPARTEPLFILVPGPPATRTPGQSIPYAPWMPAAGPSWGQAPDIVFIAPEYGNVVRDNTTEIQVSAPPSSDPGYVAYYGSADNKTWIKLGESPISGNMSGIMWAVPWMNGAYYLKAEHYTATGLRGIAYTQVLIAHEILPVAITTTLASGTDWLMLFLALIALILLSLIIVPYIKRDR